MWSNSPGLPISDRSTRTPLNTPFSLIAPFAAANWRLSIAPRAHLFSFVYKTIGSDKANFAKRLCPTSNYSKWWDRVISSGARFGATFRSRWASWLSGAFQAGLGDLPSERSQEDDNPRAYSFFRQLGDIRRRSFDSKRDARHENSLLRIKVSAITFFVRGSAYRSLANKSWEKCYDSDRKDVRSVLAFRAAAGRTLCSDANGS
jgi:hypothetical protein